MQDSKPALAPYLAFLLILSGLFLLALWMMLEEDRLGGEPNRSDPMLEEFALEDAPGIGETDQRQSVAPAESAGTDAASEGLPAPEDELWVFAGHVEDGARQRLGGASLAAGDERFVAEDDGSFRFELTRRSAERPEVLLEVSAEGYRGSVVALEQDYTVITLQADRGFPVRVVRAADEAALPGVEVELFPQRPMRVAGVLGRQYIDAEPTASAVTDSRGVAQLPTPPRFAMIRARTPGFAEGRIWIHPDRKGETADGELEAHRIAMRPEIPVQVRFSDADGKGLAEAQVGFGVQATEPVITDEDGWAEVPDFHPFFIGHIRVLTTDQRGWVDGLEGARRHLDGEEVFCDFETIEGDVRTGSGASASAFEVASVAITDDPTRKFVPDPDLEADELVWTPVAAGGSFVLNQGWQGPETMVLLRERSQRMVVDTARVVPGARVELRGSIGARLTVRLDCARPSQVEGWILHLRPASENLPGAKKPREARVVGSQASFALQPGLYAVDLKPHSSSLGRRLGRVRVEGEDLSKTFQIEALRELSGIVVAMGEPVAGARVLIGTASERRRKRLAEAWTDEKGAFEVSGVPEGPVMVRVLPNDPWLKNAGEHRVLVDGQDFVEVVLPAAILEYTAGDTDLRGLERVQLVQWFAEGANPREYALPLPPPTGSLQYLRVAAPASYRLALRSDFRALEPIELSLDPGEFQSVTLELRETGVAVLDMDDSVPEAPFYKVQVDWTGPPGAPKPDVAERRGQLQSWRLNAGRWHFRIHGLVGLYPGGEERQLLTGAAWEGDVEIGSGGVTRMVLKLDNGSAGLAVEAPRSP